MTISGRSAGNEKRSYLMAPFFEGTELLQRGDFTTKKDREVIAVFLEKSEPVEITSSN